MATSSTRWTREQVIDLVVRLRWEMSYNNISNKVVINECGLRERLKRDETCTSNFSRWLRHAEDGDKTGLLKDYELDRIQNWLNEKGSISRLDILARLLPNDISFYLQNWLASESKNTIRFETQYTVYRASAIADDRVVVGRLNIVNNDDGITTTEEYHVTDCGPKSGRYHSTGSIVQSVEGDLYLLSRFENGDLQTAIFPNTKIQKSGSGENRIITMSGVVMGIMFKEPYVTRMHCEAASSEVSEFIMTTIDKIPPQIKKALERPADIEPLNIVRF